MPHGKVFYFQVFSPEGTLCCPAKPGSFYALSRLQVKTSLNGSQQFKALVAQLPIVDPHYISKAQNSPETEARSKGQNHPQGQAATCFVNPMTFLLTRDPL